MGWLVSVFDSRKLAAQTLSLTLFSTVTFDRRITVYSASNMTRLGSLDYHRNTVECLAFATVALSAEAEEDDDDDHAPQETTQQLILAAGGRDGKVSLWKYH